jgi:hypothetical protein
MRAVVTGDRAALDQELIWDALDSFHAEFGIDELAHGGQQQWMHLTQRWRGTDRLAGMWAESRGVPCREYPVSDLEWKQLARAAGPVRNRRMLDDFQPDAVIAFPGNKGTRDCVTAAIERGLKVWAVKRQEGRIRYDLVTHPTLF